MAEQEPKRLEGVFRAERATAIEKVSGEQRIPFLRIAGPGEPYPQADGKTDVLPEGMVFISLDIEPQRDMNAFWDKVDEIEPPFRPPNTTTTRKPIPAEAWE